MKEITKYWKQTCIEFGRYVVDNYIDSNFDDIDFMWQQFQEQQAKEVVDILDDVTPNDKINCYCGHTTICHCQPLNAIEKAENDFIKSKIEEGEESGFVDKTRQK